MLIYLQRSDKDTGVKEKIEQLGRKAAIYTADLASAKDVKELTPRVLADGHDIVSSVTKPSLKSTDRGFQSILVNCAGIQRRHPAHEFPDEDWNEV